MRNIFKKINVRKGILILFAFSAAMPFLSIIGANLTTKLSDVFKTEAADNIDALENLPDPAGYVTAPADKMYYDGSNRMVYSLPYSSGKDVYKVSAVINLNKKSPKSIEAFYHLENYTAIKDEDFTVPKSQKVVIPAFSTSVTVTFDVKANNFGVSSGNNSFNVTRAFRFVLDTLKDANGKEYPIYDRDLTGYRLVSGKLYNSDVYCQCPHKYNFVTMDQYEGVKSKGILKTFNDYYDFIWQTFGTGKGSVEENNYDIGGGVQSTKNFFGITETKTMDGQYGRWYATDIAAKGAKGGIRVCPQKTNNYYDKNLKRNIGPYRDWLNRIVLTNLGHSYGSFNFYLNHGHDKPELNHIQSFYLGDYSFVTSDKDHFGYWTLTNTPGNETKIKRDHYSWCINFRLNNRHENNWYITESDLETFKSYMERVVQGNDKIDSDDDLLSGYAWSNSIPLNKADEVKKITIIDYNRVVSEKFLNKQDQKICWFPLVNNNTPETFGFNLFHQHLDSWFWRGDLGAKGQTFFTVLDDVEPTIQNKTVIETGSVLKNGKVRISVRFNEPVQAFEHSYFTADAGSGCTLTFKPVAGQMEGCDTVVYEADTKDFDDVFINKITVNTDILYEENPSKINDERFTIHDYAQGGGHKLPARDENSNLRGRSFDVAINKKKPVISRAPGEISKDPKQNATAQIIVSYLNQGKLYYSFVKDEGGFVPNSIFTDNEVSTDKVYSNCLQISNLENNSQISLEMPSSKLRSGNFYCFVKAVTNMGVEKMFPVDITSSTKIDTGVGPFIIDNIAPTIKITKDPTTFNAMERKFNVTVNENCNIDKLTVKLNKTYGVLSEQMNTFDVTLEKSTDDPNLYTGSFTLTLDGILNKYYTIKETGKHVFNPDLEYEDFSLNFSAVDKAGNKQDVFEWNGQNQKSPIILPFSKYPYIPVEIKSISKSPVISEIENLNLYPTGTSFTFQATSGGTIGLLEASVNKLPKNSAGTTRTFYGSHNDEISGINISQGDPQEQNKSIVTLTKPGYYEIIIRNLEGCYSDAFKFYITDNLQEKTPNFVNAMESVSLVPKNNAWELQPEARLYYLDESAGFHSVGYEGIQDPLFSSKGAAKNYIKGHEYQDLYLIKLDMHTASILNGSGGVAGYQRATYESTVAREGQYWVRYKNFNWSINSQSSTSWAYYFYCEPTEESEDVKIDLDVLNRNKILASQIDIVAETLSNLGKTIYLVDDDHIDAKTGAPKLTEGQLAATKEFVIEKTLSNSPVNSIVIKGDNEMYANFVTVNNGEAYKPYRLGTNLKLVKDENIQLYVKLAVGSEQKYRKIEPKDGTTLKEALNTEDSIATSGIYKILEISPEGAHTFEVYVDKDNPQVEVERSVYDPVEGKTIPVKTTINGSISLDFYSKEFQINGYPKNETVYEVDDYAYVAVFKRGVLCKFGYLNQLDGNPLILEDGIYEVVVGDRSGNRYSFRAFVSGTEIEVKFTPIGDNSKLTIEVTNREEAELLKFDVYYNDELLESDLTNPKTFKQSGSYYAIVQDQYGNKTKTETFNFSKVMPKIDLYYIENGMVYPYKEGDENSHIILTVGEESMLIKTCSMLKIGYKAETTAIYVEGCDPSYYVNNTEKGTVTFNTPCNFTFYVYYKDNVEEYVKYEVIYDANAPDIVGEYKVPEYDFEDLKVENFDTHTNTPNSLDYRIKTVSGGQVTKTVLVSNGSTISADYIYFKVTDNTKVKSITLTRDGVEVPVDLLDQGFNGFEFAIEGIPGKYKLVASDIFGQSTNIEFIVDNSEFSKATIDGNAVSPVGPLSIDGHKVLYGNKNATIVCNDASSITIRYKDANGTYAIRISCDSNGYFYTTYLLGEDENVPIITDKSNRIDIASFPFIPFEGIDLTIAQDSKGVLTINYVAGSILSNLDVRVVRKDEAYNLYNMEFSKTILVPEFYDGTTKIDPINHYVYASKEARIVDVTGDITKIYIAFNPMEESFDDANYVLYTNDYKFQNGFYSYKIINKYGIQDQYTVIISDKFEVSVILTYFDKDPETYTVKYGDVFASNRTITVVGYNLSYMAEEHNRGELITEDSKLTIIFTEPGFYTLEVIDKYNNHATLYLAINSIGIEYREEWLTGYNDAALLKNQGYTNQKLSINLTEEQAQSLGITQIYYTYNDKKTILYGYAGGNIDVPFDSTKLKDVIGSEGDGVYYVYFSNYYGDVCVKEIHYQVAPTLTIERTTNLSGQPELIDLSKATKDGVWSNLKVNLATTLNEGQYAFYVKSDTSPEFERQTINYLFELSNSVPSGEVHYTVKYIDAYGNSYEFTINLLRRQLSFNTSNINLLTVDNTTYTKANFYFDFDPNDVSVTYALNGGKYVDYSPKALMFKDGLYEFFMFDKAGNQTSFVVTKDSIVVFQVNVNGNQVNAYSGIAINGEKLSITSDVNESVTLVSAKLDGEKINSSDLQFAKTGQYELILKDKVGNLRYFKFYLVCNELKEFEYTTTSDYFVSNSSFTNAAGIKVAAMEKVSDNGTHINLLNAEEGIYEFQIKNKYDNSIRVLTIVISKELPTAILDGCKDGERTTHNVTLAKLSSGDVVTVYRDGKQVQQIEVGTTTNIDPITEGGKYRIVIKNKAGSTIEYNFERLTIANGALSALIIVGLLTLSGGFFAVLLLRNRSKNDD